MLTTSATLTGNDIANETFLSGKRQGWSPPYFSDLKKRIDAAFSNYLGIDSAMAQRSATQAVLQLQAAALSDLSDVRVQIEADFKSDPSRRTEILKQLGYADFYSQARKKDQEGLIQLLYRFRTNLTPALTAEITGKGTGADYLDRISSYADQLSQANITQETVKGAKKIITSEAVTEFNAIYSEVINIAKIARNFYRGDPDRQELFSYTKIHKRLNAFSSAKPAEEVQSKPAEAQS
jgi:hypothetical protein